MYFISLNKSKGKDSPSPGSLPSLTACSNKEVGLYDVTDILGCWLLLSHFSRVGLCATPSLGFSRQEHWSGLPFPSPMHESESEVAQSCLTLRDPMDCSLPGSSIHGIFQARVLKWGAIAFSENEVVKVALIQSDHRPYKKIIFVYSTRHMC